MYFVVKYIDYDTFEKTKDVDLSNQENENEVIKKALKATNKELTVNPDCFVGIILDYIFDEIGIPDKCRADFDVITPQGKKMNVQNYPPTFRGLDVFLDRAQYYVAFCSNETMKPILSKKSPEHVEFFEGPKVAKVPTKKSRTCIKATKESSLTLTKKASSGKSIASKSKTSI